MILDGVGDGPHLPSKVWRHGNGTEALIGADERVRKTVKTVSVRDDTFTLYVVQNFTNLLGSKFVMIQE